jgi:hypothetical protein
MAFTYQDYTDDYNLDIFPPDQVTGLSTAAGNEQVKLTWIKPSNGGSVITDFTIQQSTDDATWSTIVDGVSEIASHIVTGLDNGTLYYFRVSASNIAGSGDYSTSKSATPAYTTGTKLLQFPEINRVQGTIKIRGNTRLPQKDQVITVHASLSQMVADRIPYKGVIECKVQHIIEGQKSRPLLSSRTVLIGSKIKSLTESVIIKGKKDYVILLDKFKELGYGTST